MASWKTEHGVEFNVLLLYGPLLIQPVIHNYANAGRIGRLSFAVDLCHKMRYWHEFEHGCELGLGGGRRQVVVERRDPFADLLRGKFERPSPHAEGVLKHLNPVNQVRDGAPAVG